MVTILGYIGVIRFYRHNGSWRSAAAILLACQEKLLFQTRSLRTTVLSRLPEVGGQ